MKTAETRGLRHYEFRGVRQENLLGAILTPGLSRTAILVLLCGVQRFLWTPHNAALTRTHE